MKGKSNPDIQLLEEIWSRSNIEEKVFQLIRKYYGEKAYRICKHEPDVMMINENFFAILLYGYDLSALYQITRTVNLELEGVRIILWDKEVEALRKKLKKGELNGKCYRY